MKKAQILSGEIYTLTSGWYKGRRVRVIWVNTNRNVNIQGAYYADCTCELVTATPEEPKKITCFTNQLADLSLNVEELINYDTADTLTLIRAAKAGEKQAVIAFIKRFKKMPKL